MIIYFFVGEVYIEKEFFVGERGERKESVYVVLRIKILFELLRRFFKVVGSLFIFGWINFVLLIIVVILFRFFFLIF